jgi:AAA domain
MKNVRKTSKFVVHKGRNPVKAVYIKPELSGFEGNPLAEALPPLLTTEQVIKRLNYKLEFNPSNTLLPDKERFLHIQEALTFFVPLDVHLELEESFASIIRMGYLSRNPFLKEYWLKINKKLETFDQYAEQYESDSDPSWTASGFNIVGISGVGKSRSVIRILNLYPQVIRHSEYENAAFTESQIVWLKIECPRDGSLRDLCLSFFYSVDSIVGTTYFEDYSKGKPSIDNLLLSMKIVAANHFLGVLVIDEIQRLSFAKSGGADSMLNFFVALINTIGVPVVLVGTYKAISILSGEFSQMRRGTGQGDVVWHRMDNDDQWDLFINAMEKYQYTRHKVKLTKKLKDTLYEESQGITDFAVKLFYFAQKRAIESKVEKITVGIIRAVAKDKFNIPRRILNALKTGDTRVLQLFEDIYPKNLEENFLLPTHPKEKFVEPPVTPSEPVKNESDDSNLSKKTSKIASALKNNTNKKTNHVREFGLKSSKNNKTGNLKKLLINCAKEVEGSSSQVVYEHLKKTGFMRSASEFITN